MSAAVLTRERVVPSQQNSAGTELEPAASQDNPGGHTRRWRSLDRCPDFDALGAAKTSLKLLGIVDYTRICHEMPLAGEDTSNIRGTAGALRLRGRDPPLPPSRGDSNPRTGARQGD